MRVTSVTKIQEGRGHTVYEVRVGDLKWRTKAGHVVNKTVRHLEGREVKSFTLEGGEIVGVEK
jgi:hypothetical protein